MVVSSYLEKSFNISINEETAQLLNSHSSTVTFDSGQVAVHEGDYSSNLYFIIKGLVRGYYIDENGNDITKCFSSENEFFSTEGFRTNQKSSFNIECLENCTCVVFPYELIRKGMKHDKKIENLVNMLYLNEVGNLERRNKKLMLLNAEKRYISFCKEYPTLSSRVAQKYIASYIGIQSPSLSRIRRKIKEMVPN